MIRKIIHIDMDCFYAAIETRDFPSLRGKPLAVGGNPGARGVISTCNYEARRYGVRSAMSSHQALKLCPHLVIQPVRMDIYREESHYIRDIFAEYTDKIEPLSLDEAFLDVTDSPHCQGSASWIAREIRARIFEERALTASAGIAPNKALAKIASDWQKPNGQMVIAPDFVDIFMQDLPVRKLFGVGPVMESRLKHLGIMTCGALQVLSKVQLSEHFGVMGERLYDLARGIDERPVEARRIRKSISVEETFSKDLVHIEACKQEVPSLMACLHARIEKSNVTAEIHAVFVKIKFNDFQQTTTERAVNEVSLELVYQLLVSGWERKCLPVRLIGVGIRLVLSASDEAGYQQLKLPLDMGKQK